MTCLIWCMEASIVSVFPSKWKNLYAWNSCSLVLPIFEHCCLNEFCSPIQSSFTSLRESYQSLASPVNVRQNLWTLSLSWSLWVSIQTFVLSKCSSASLSGFLENLGVKWDQFNGGICSMGCCSACSGLWDLRSWWSWRVLSFFGDRRGQRAIWFDHHPSFMVMISFTLILSSMCIL